MFGQDGWEGETRTDLNAQAGVHACAWKPLAKLDEVLARAVGISQIKAVTQPALRYYSGWLAWHDGADFKDTIYMQASSDAPPQFHHWGNYHPTPLPTHTRVHTRGIYVQAEHQPADAPASRRSTQGHCACR